MQFYVDTSVWGGVGDNEFSLWTIPFFEQVRNGLFSIIISDLTLRELSKAPEYIKNLPTTIPPQYLEIVKINEEIITLSESYLKEGVLNPKFQSDAQHIAVATIMKADSLISWNFKHMVNFFRIRQYNSINLKYGYSVIDIRTPKEVIYEK
jgi:predicted nucleic acid-binding protein